MSDLNPVVVEREECPLAEPCPDRPVYDGQGYWLRCDGCLGDGFRAVLDSAREVERGSDRVLYGNDTGEDDCFVILEELGRRRTWVETEVQS